MSDIGVMAVSGGICNLLNGWLARKQQKELSEGNQAFQRELQMANFEHQKQMQESQMKLQLMLQERNFIQAERLQKELQGLQFQYSLKLQEANFQHQEDIWEKTQFYQNTWPLISTQRNYVESITKTAYEKMRMPFQIISTDLGANYEKINTDVANFFNMYYPLSSDSSTWFYNKGWKKEMGNLDGNAQITALHSALAGLPTLVLMPKIVGTQFTLNAAMWGMGDLSLPDIHKIITVDLNELRLEAIRNDLSKKRQDIDTYNLPLEDILNPSDKANMKVFEEEQKLRDNLKSKNIPEDVITGIIKNKFGSSYSFQGKDETIINFRNAYISQLIMMNAAVITDYYFLTEYKVQPKLPVSFAHEKIDWLKSMIAKSFLDMLEVPQDMPLTSMVLNMPYYQALTAHSFIASGDNETARELQNKMLEIFNERYSSSKECSETDFAACELLKQENLTQKKIPELSYQKIPELSYQKKESITILLASGVSLDMILVEAGSFTMSANDGENYTDEVSHTATLTQDFYIGKYEVTQEQWESVMGVNPSKFKGNKLPVECVSWHDAMEFCEKLNKSGKAPIGYHFTLPTETQWEYAAKGGKKSKGYKYSGSNTVGEVAWYDGNSGSKTHEVGTKAPNELGLYDMSGNVWEWCLDDYTDDSSEAKAEFTRGKDSSSSYRVDRGGSWSNDARLCRAAYRICDDPSYTSIHLGFRVALATGQN